MSKMDTWMPFYVGDYLSATGRLTTEQHGAYLLILLDYWKNGPPPNDDTTLAAIARLAPTAWRKAKPALIGFFEVRDGLLIQKRVEKERGRTSEINQERSKAGKIGAAKRWQNHSKPIANANGLPLATLANAKQTQWQNDAPSQPQKKEEEESPSPAPTRATDCFNEVCTAADWNAANDTQRQVGLSIIDGWLALGCSLEMILDGIARARKSNPAPTRSLKRFDSTIRGKRRDELGGELPITKTDVDAITGRAADALRVN